MRRGPSTVREVARLGLPLMRRDRRLLPAILAVGIAASVAEGIGLSLFIPLLDTVVDRDQVGHGTLPQLFASLLDGMSHDTRLTIVCGALLASVVLRAGLGYANNAMWAHLYAHISHDLRTRVHGRLLDARYGWLVRHDEGRLLNALSNETWNATDAIRTLTRMAITSSMVLVYVVLLTLISWQRTILVGIALACISATVRRITRRVAAMSVEVTQANGALAGRMLETVEGAKVIRTFGREIHHDKQFDDASGRVTGLLRNLELVKVSTGPLYEVLAATVLVTVLYLSLRADPANLGSLLVFVAVLYRLQPRVRQLDSQRISLLSLVGSVREVSWLLGGSDDRSLPDGPLDAAQLEAGFRMEHVTFSYADGAPPALRDVSLTIPSGKTTAIVGPSGGGKSTLVDLLLRLHDPTIGAVRFGAVPLTDLRVASLRDRIAVVSQDAHLFNASVRDNIAYARDGIDEQQIRTAAALAHADEFIERLPDGYDTVIGDDGVRLSGGQRQRIALARALARGADVLVLDEATNALDSIAESAVLDALELVAEGTTLIVVAHRLSTVRRADQIVVLDRGEIIEQGPPHELLQHDGMYALLSGLQGAHS